LVEVLVRKTGTEEHNINHDQNLFEAGILGQKEVFDGRKLLKRVVFLVAKFMELAEQAMEVSVLFFQVLTEVAEH
jgi:hypothetical protein